MKFKINLPNEELEIIKMKAKNKPKITCYCNLPKESDAIIFPEESYIFYNKAIIPSNSNKLSYVVTDEFQGFILYDKYNTIVLSIADSQQEKYITIDNIENNIYIIVLHEFNVSESVDTIYPIFSREIENIDGSNVGLLYANFSPLTPESKYVVQEVEGTTHYINAIFDVFEEDSNFTLFNYLGLGIGETFIRSTQNMECIDILLLYKLENYGAVFITKEGEHKKISYASMVNSNNDNAYLIAKNNCLVYSDSDKFINIDLKDNEEMIINEISTLEPSDLKYSDIVLDIDNILNSDVELTEEEKEFWSVKISLAIELYDKLSAMKLFELYDILIYIDKDNKINVISELEDFYNKIQEVLKLV